MASCDHLFADATAVLREIINENEKLDSEKSLRTHAAVVLQSAWRGREARQTFLRLNKAATIIQKWVRGWLVRNNLVDLMIEYEYKKHREIYDKAATKIQALWRGHAFRKRNNFHKNYVQRMGVQRKNLELRQQMLENMQGMEERRKIQVEIEAKNMVFKLSKIEELLASVKFTEYMKELRKKYNANYKEKPSHYQVPILKAEKKVYKHKKPFCYDPRIFKKYEALLDNSEPFKMRVKDIQREMIFPKNICDCDFECDDKYFFTHKKDFDLTQRKVPPKNYPPPYHLDFWNLGCDIHDIQTTEENL